MDKLFRKKFHYHRFFLHAFSLDFPHPITKEQMHIECPISPSFEKVLRELRSQS
jgi:23S rRNA-/tRNA-specific pseudouridylate synthase